MRFKRSLAAALCAFFLCGCDSGGEFSSITEISFEPVSSKTSEIISESEPPEEEPLVLEIDPKELYSQSVYAADYKTGNAVYEKDPDKRLYPASITKIMTCIVCLENVRDLNEKVACPYECFADLESENPNFQGAALAWIEGEQDNLTYRDCLYAMMLPSGCDAANILAYNAGGGSIENFVIMMNRTARKIGCGNTHFTNPSGLFEEDNYSTARDMYMITHYAMENYPEFMKICTTFKYEMPENSYFPEGYAVYQSNALMMPKSDYYLSYVSGIKTGSIDKYFIPDENGEFDEERFEIGARTLVSHAKYDDREYIVVSLGAAFYDDENDGSVIYSALDHRRIYKELFGEIEEPEDDESAKASSEDVSEDPDEEELEEPA